MPPPGPLEVERNEEEESAAIISEGERVSSITQHCKDTEQLLQWWTASATLCDGEHCSQYTTTHLITPRGTAVYWKKWF